MMRLVAVAFALALASSVQAKSTAPIHHPENMVSTVRTECGAGFHRVNAICVRKPIARIKRAGYRD